MAYNSQTATAKQIISIPDDRPELIFMNDADEAKKEYKALIKKWHPDVNSDPLATEVVSKITTLYDSATRKIKNGEWRLFGMIEFSCTDSRIRRIRYRKEDVFDFGTLYYGDSVAAYVYDQKFAAEANLAVANIKSIRYADDKIKKQHQEILPDIVSTFQIDDGRTVIVLSKESQSYRLDHVLQASGGFLTPGHTAWVMSRLYAFACFFSIEKTSFNAMNAANFFISPSRHALFLNGGWEYKTRLNAKISKLPKFNYDYGHRQTIKDKFSQGSRHDLYSIKAIGRSLLGDVDGFNLINNPVIPKEMASFLMSGSNGDAIKEYGVWKESVLPKCFGKPRFVEMKISDSDIYSEV